MDIKIQTGTGQPLTANLTRRELLKGGAALVALGMFGSLSSACGSESGTSASPTSTASGPRMGGVLRVGVSGGSTTDTMEAQDPLSQSDVARVFQLYDTLLARDENWKLVNSLAEEVSSSDAQTWTIRLKPDLVFSDGRPVTSEEVIHSFRRIIDPKNPKATSSSLKALKPSGMRKIDKLTCEFKLEEPLVILPEVMARYCAIVPTDYDPNKPIGTGPFVLESFTPGELTVFTPNENYWGEGPYVDRLELVDLVDDSARVNALLAGNVEAIDQVPQGQIPVIEQSAQILQSHTGMFVPFTMRVDEAPFEDVRVRQAMRFLIDRQGMIDQAVGGLGWLGNDVSAPFDPFYRKDLPQREQDLEQAKSLLKQAGQEDLRVELVTSAIAAGAVEAAQVFKEQAKSAGVDVTLRKTDPSQFWEQDYLNSIFSQDYWYPRDYLFQAVVSSLPGATMNTTHTTDPEWIAICEEALRTMDDDKRRELVEAAQLIEYERGGWIIWSYYDTVNAYSTKLTGLKPDASGIPLGSWHLNLVSFVQ